MWRISARAAIRGSGESSARIRSPVALQVIKPVRAGRRSARPERSIDDRRRAGKPTKSPSVELALEGSLRHLEVEISFRYIETRCGNTSAKTEATRAN